MQVLSFPQLQGPHIDYQANTDVREYGEADQVSTCQGGQWSADYTLVSQGF